MSVLLAAGAMLPLTILAGDGLNRVSKPVAVLEIIWLGIAMGKLMEVSGANWPGKSAELVVPMALLSLAALTGNREKGERTCCTLFWVMLIPAIGILAVLAGNTEPKWLKPEPKPWNGALTAVLLYPVIAGIRKGTDVKTGLTIALLAGILAVILQGGLGLEQASFERSPLYELGRCIGNGGFEILISVVLTISWYGFACTGMNAAEAMGEKLSMKNLESRVITGIIAGIILLIPETVTGTTLLWGALLLWILVPLMHLKK